MSAFVLKVIALISMTLDHSSYVIFGGFSFLNYIGRFAFPIFAFQISEGYIYTKSLKKYFFRLFCFALISQLPFMLFTSMYSANLHLNIFFTLFLGLLAILIFDKLNKLEHQNIYMHYLYDFIGIISVILIAMFSELLHCDYGYYGVLIIFVFHLFKKNKLFMSISFVLCTIFYYLPNLLRGSNTIIYILLTLCTCFPIVFIDFYNNKKGKDTKYFLYLFYPLHLLVLWAINFTVSSIL